jgi:hypothetical protein
MAELGRDVAGAGSELVIGRKCSSLSFSAFSAFSAVNRLESLFLNFLSGLLTDGN